MAGTVVSGPVSGTWSQTGSPYWVEGDLQVAAGNTLVVEPGCQVRFRGAFRLLVNGSLQAVGTASDSILFTWDQAIPAHEWRGIRLVGADVTTRLEHCRIEHVRAATTYPDVRGGAIYCEACSPTILRCLLQHNVSHNSNANGMGGGVACVGASAKIGFCVIRDNQADSGGGICTIEECVPVIRNNVITGNAAPNSGGGIYAGVRSSPIIENNLIIGNTAQGWGGGGITLWNWYAMFPFSKTVRNNVVAENSTTAVGGGFYIRYDFSVLDNNTVIGNTASQGGGLYILNQGAGDYPPDLHNFIIWGNAGGTTPAIRLDPTYGSVVYVTYSDVQGGWAGAGNLDVDPAFADGEGHLPPESACVDAGSPDPLYDDDCFPPSHGGVRDDMGAYGGPGGCGWLLGASSVERDPTAPMDEPGDAPAREWSLGASPNPFAVATVVTFNPPPGEQVRLQVFEPSGRLVRALLSDGARAWGRQARRWDGMDECGTPVAAGTYFFRLEVDGRSAVVKGTLLR
jgi:parallel beta-helix repeat protein